MSKLFKLAKRCIPTSIKGAIRRKLHIPEDLILGEEQANHIKMPISTVRIAIYAGGGMGDFITYIPILDQLMSICDCVIDFYTGNMIYASALYAPRANLRIIPERFQHDVNSYDLILDIAHCCAIRKVDFRSLHNKAPALYSVVEKIQKFNDTFFLNVNRHGMPTLALRQSKFLELNRWAFLSADGALEMSDQRSSIFIDMKSFDVIKKYDLYKIKYIVINRSADPASGGCRQTKVWPKEKYEDFIRIIKKRFPEIKIVQIVVNKDPEINGVDCVVRNEKIEDVKVIIKCSSAVISSEGGIAHLATQLSVPTVVVFGPTPVYYYGYKRNVNIVSPFCSDCMEAMPDWYTSCPRGFSTAKCMEAISGDMVADAVSKILDDGKDFHYTVENLSIYTSKAFNEYSLIIRDIVRKNSMKAENSYGHIFGPVRTYIHASKRWEYPYILEQIKLAGKRLKIADVGAGRGALSLYLAQQGHDVTVYDMNYNWENNDVPQTHNRFMRYCAENRVKAKIATGFNLPEDDESFDVVVSTSVIEHVVHKEYILKEMLRIVKPGGILIMTYDLIESNMETSLTSSQIEVLTPSSLNELFELTEIKATPYSEEQVRTSQTEIRADGIEIHPDLTVGGCVIRKSARV